MNPVKIFAYVLAVAVGVAFTAQAWAMTPVATATNGTVVKSMLHKVDEAQPKDKGKKEKKRKKKKKDKNENPGTDQK